MKKVYRIVKHTYYESGDKKKQYYSVQCQIKILWWKLWDTITDSQCHNEECKTFPLTFHTELDAINLINNLQNGNKLSGWDKEVITVLEFPKTTNKE
jgi:hypothetical protein